MENNIVKHTFSVSRVTREKNLNQKSQLFWFTGLSGSGKSTVANALEESLSQRKIATYILDGDTIRAGINSNLSFTNEDRKENLRRIAEIAKLFLDAGIVVIAAFVSPFEHDRQMVKNIVGAENFNEIYISTSLQVCEKRDTKGFYKLARAGKINNFTGVNAAFEVPENADLTIDTEKIEIDEALLMLEKFIIPKIEY